jgi:hypothetical protein
MLGGDVNKTKVTAGAPQAERDVCAAGPDTCGAGTTGSGPSQLALTHRDFIKEKRDVVKKFTRGIVKATDYIKANKKGTTEVIQKYFEINDPKVVESIYNQVSDKFSPEMPPDLIRDLFESRTTPELGWPQGKPLPDPEQFVDRSILNEVLKEMGRKPGGK